MQALREAGIEVEAPDLTDGEWLDWALRMRPQVVVASGKLPPEWWQRLKAETWYRSTPAIHIGIPSPDIDGCGWVPEIILPGPFRPTTLVGAVHALCGRRCVEPRPVEEQGEGSREPAAAASSGVEEEWLDDLVEQAADAFFVHDMHGRFVKVNHRACESLGYTRGELLSMTVFDIEQVLDPAKLLAVWGQPAHRDATVEGVHRRKDGSCFPVEIRVSRCTIAGEYRYLGLARDITERRFVEQSLHDSESRYRTLFASMQEGFALGEIICDTAGKPADWRYLEVNPAFEAMFACKRDEVVGRTFRELFPDEPWEYWVAGLGQVALTGSAGHLDQFASESGRHYDAIAYSPQPGQFAGIFTDVTGRRQAQEALRQQRELLRVTLNSIGDAVLATDVAGKITFFNPGASRLTGWSEELALGRRAGEVFRVINEETHEPAEDIVGRVLSEGWIGPPAYDTAVVSGGGREIPIENSAAPIRDGAGKLAGAVLVFHDVSEKRKAREALRESERRVRRKLDTVLSPEGDIGNLELRDIIDVPAVQSLLEKFYKLAPMTMAIVDLQGRALVGVGWQDVCTKFHRVQPESCRHCIESDTQLSAGVPPGECRLYKCKNNMWDIASPISIGGRHVGNIFSGQFFLEGETVDRELFRGQARRYGFEEREYLEAMDRVPRLSRDFVEAGMAFLMQLGHMLSLLSYSNIELARLLAERESLMVSLDEASEQRRLALDAAELGAWDYRFDTGKVFWDRRSRQLFGVAGVGQVDYQEAISRIHTEDRTATEEALRAALAGANAGGYHREFRVVWPDGSVHWVDSHGRVYYEDADDPHRPTRFIGVHADITARKSLEEQLRQRAEEVRTLMDVAPVAILVAHDADCRQITGNRMANEIYESAGDENVAASATRARRFFKDGRELGANELPMEEAAARGIEIRDSELEVLLPSGRRVHMLGHASPLYDSHGRVRGCVGTFLDITDRRRSEERLRESEEKFRGAFANAAIGFAVATTDGLTLDANPAYCAITGYRVEDLMTLKFYQLIHPEDRSENQRLIERTLAGETTDFVIENRYVRKTGETVWVRKSTSLIKDAEGSPHRIISLVEDITERKKAEQALRDSESRLRTLSDNLPEAAICRFRYDTRGKPHVDFISAGIERLTGVPPAEFMNDARAVARSILPEDQDKVMAAIAVSRERLTHLEVEVRHVHRTTGEIRWSLLRSIPFRNPDGSTTWDGIELDVTERKKTEEALRRFELLAAHTRDIILFMQRDSGRILEVNAAAVDAYGYSRDELLALSIGDLRAPTTRTMMAAEMTEADSRTILFETVHRRKDGNVFPVEVSSQGATIGGKRTLISVVRDITERRRTEERLRESEEKFRSAFANAAIGFAMTTADGAIMAANAAYCALVDCTAGDLDGLNFLEMVHPDDRAENMRLMARMLSGQIPDFVVENRYVRKTGPFVWVRKSVSLVRDPEGAPQWIISLVEDITERKKAEQALRDSESRLRNLTDHLPEAAICRYRQDAGGEPQIDFISAGIERLTGVPPAELMNGAALERWILPEDHEKARAAISRSRQEMTHFEVEVRHRHRATGEIRWSMLRSTPFRNADGSTTWDGIDLDITERKRAAKEALRAQEAAETANHAKSTFLATMSHEIRTPMNAILGMADLLWESNLDAEQRHYVEVFRRAGSNLVTLINDILDLSKIESGNLELERVSFSIEEVVDQAVTLTGAKARSKGIDLLSRLSPDLPAALIGDPTRLRQVLINLLGNAVKFTEVGEVVLTARNRQGGVPGEICFEVSDTGIGIAAEKLESVFGDFTQADSSTTRKYGGTGLGLSISRRLVQSMGGALVVRSTVGVGSTFQFELPFGIAPSSRANVPGEMEDLLGRRVLVIDDNATNRLILRETLTFWGMKSREFGTGAAALEDFSSACAGGLPYSLVLVDRRMPGIDGFELARKIQQVDKRVPIVMLSSETQPGDSARSHEVGLASILLKPVPRTQLLRIICRAMEIREQGLPGTGAEKGVIHSSKPMRPLALLIAEDSPDNRLLIAAYLKVMPYRLTFAEDGRRAVEEFQAGRFDLILMDMQMPVLDGLGATRAIRSLEIERAAARTPILALTANARVLDAEASHEAGCDGHLSKPISKQTLIDAIEKYANVARDVMSTDSAQPERCEIPPGLEDLVPGYLAARRRELPEMLAMLAASDFERLRFLAHNMKGSGASFGFSKLTEIGSAMEQAAKAQDGPCVTASLGQLKQYLETVAAREGSG